MKEQIKQYKLAIGRIVLQFDLGYFQDMDYIYSTMRNMNSEYYPDKYINKMAHNLDSNLKKFKQKSNALLYILCYPDEYKITDEHLNNIAKFIEMYDRIKIIYKRCLTLCSERNLNQHGFVR